MIHREERTRHTRLVDSYATGPHRQTSARIPGVQVALLMILLLDLEYGVESRQRS